MLLLRNDLPEGQHPQGALVTTGESVLAHGSRLLLVLCALWV